MTVKIGKNVFKLIRKPEISIDMELGNILIVINLVDSEENIYELKINYTNKYCSVELLQKNTNIWGVYYDYQN